MCDESLICKINFKKYFAKLFVKDYLLNQEIGIILKQKSNLRYVSSEWRLVKVFTKRGFLMR